MNKAPIALPNSNLKSPVFLFLKDINRRFLVPETFFQMLKLWPGKFRLDVMEKFERL